ncbi:MAG: hypothetical protein HZB44_07915 [Actinobacteria bacterium]|nr:hypothetical protein [Actinomycetota bacterium]
MKIGITIILIGVALVAYSLTMSPYDNEELFNEGSMSLYGQSEEYWELRDEMLTPKYSIQDYGGTLILGGVVIILLAISHWKPVSSSKGAVICLALTAPFLSSVALVFDLVQGQVRGEFPPWGDSLGIPLMGVPILWVALSFWALIHLVFLFDYSSEKPLTLAFSFKANWWLLFVSFLSALLIIWCLVFGAFWYAIPGLMWLYFYLALAAGRRGSLKQVVTYPLY